MVFSFIKNWFKSWALWVWVLFIGLLASDAESVPRLQSSTEVKGEVNKKTKIIKRKKGVTEVIENENDEENDEENVQIVYISPEILTEDKDNKSVASRSNEEAAEESPLDKEVEEDADGNIVKQQVIEDQVEKLREDENEELSDNREDIEDEEEEEDDVHWIDAGRGTGLARYIGLQNLLEAEESIDKPLFVERRAPVVTSRREGGPLMLPRGMLIKSLSQEKERLEEIPEEERSPRVGEEGVDNSDKIWAQLVARYAEESEPNLKTEKISAASEQNKTDSTDQVKDFSDMTSKEFSEEVGKRLQLYLERVDDSENDNADEDGSREVDETGKHKIFIMIEDDESNGEKEETEPPEEFNASNSDVEIIDFTEMENKEYEQMQVENKIQIIVTDATEEYIKETEQLDDEVCEDDKIFPVSEECDITVPDENVFVNKDVIVTSSSKSVDEDVEEICASSKSVHESTLIQDESLQIFTEEVIPKEEIIVDNLVVSESIKVKDKELESKEETPAIEELEPKEEASAIEEEIIVDDSGLSGNIKVEDLAVEVNDVDSKEDAPVFTVTLRRKSKPVIASEPILEDVPVLSDLRTEEVSSEVPVPEDASAISKPVPDIPATSGRDIGDVPAVTIILPKKKKTIAKDILGEKLSSEVIDLRDKEENEKKDSVTKEKFDFHLGKDSAEQLSRDLPRSMEDVFRKSEENLMRLNLGTERRSSRDLWKKECEKYLEDSDQVDIKISEEIKVDDIFITRYEEFPEDYVQEEVTQDFARVDEKGSAITEEISDTDADMTNLDETKTPDAIEESGFVAVDNDFEFITSVQDEEKLEQNRDDDIETFAIKRKLDETESKDERDARYEEDERELENIPEKSIKKMKEDILPADNETEMKEDILPADNETEMERASPGKDLPRSVQLANVCDILTHSEQNLVARILAQKVDDDDDEVQDEKNDYLEIEAAIQEIENSNLYATDSLQDLAGKAIVEEQNEELIEFVKDDSTENLYFEETNKFEQKETDVKSASSERELYAEAESMSTNVYAEAESMSTNVDDSRSAKDSLTEKEIILELIRKERDPGNRETIDESEVPEFLEDFKDLLVPRVRRKKVRRRYDPLSEILKVDESAHAPSKSSTYSKIAVGQDVLMEEDPTSHFKSLTPEAKESSPSKENEFLLTEEEQRELEEIKKEQEAYRAAQRKELEKFLAMPAALTEQEQRELEEFLAEEETDKAAIAGSEARLEALLAEVRRRLLESGVNLDDENLDNYMSLPVDLTEEEERLLANEEEEEEEKGRSDFDTDEEYREYIKQRYLDELEEDRIRVEEEELEFGEYYDEEYDYDDEAYGGEYLESDYVVMSDDGDEARKTLKDEAVGTDEVVEIEGNKSKKGKKFFSIPGLRSRGSSKGSPRGSRGSLDKQGSKDSSREGSVSDEAKEQKQSKKFFRFGSLSIKRKKKSDGESPHRDPEFEMSNEPDDLEASSDLTEPDDPEAPLDLNPERIITGIELESKKGSHTISTIFRTSGPEEDSEMEEIIRKKRMLLLLKSMQKYKRITKSESTNIGATKTNNNNNNNNKNNNNDNNNNDNDNNYDNDNNTLSDKNKFLSNNMITTSTFNTKDINSSDFTILDRDAGKGSTEILNDSIVNLRMENPVVENDWGILDPELTKNLPAPLTEEDAAPGSSDQIPKTRVGKIKSKSSPGSDKCVKVESFSPVLSEVSNRKGTAMSREGGALAASSSANGVSAIDDDSLECASDVSSDVQSAAFNTSLGAKLFPQPVENEHRMDRQPSLQELIEAELTARFAPLQPDSLESLLTRDGHEFTRSVVNGDEVTTCTMLDSLEAPPFSLDSLADAESGVDLTSPHNPNSEGPSPVPSHSHIPVSDDPSNYDNNNIDDNFGLSSQLPTQIELEIETRVTSATMSDYIDDYTQTRHSQCIELIEPVKPDDMKGNVTNTDPIIIVDEVHARNGMDTEKGIGSNSFEHENTNESIVLVDNQVSVTFANLEGEVNEHAHNESKDLSDLIDKKLILDSQQVIDKEEEVSVVEGYLRMSQPNGIEIKLEEKQENIQIYESAEAGEHESQGERIENPANSIPSEIDIKSVSENSPGTESSDVHEHSEQFETDKLEQPGETDNLEHFGETDNLEQSGEAEIQIDNEKLNKSTVENGIVEPTVAEGLDKDDIKEISEINKTNSTVEHNGTGTDVEIVNKPENEAIDDGSTGSNLASETKESQENSDSQLNNKLTNGFTDTLEPSETRIPDPIAKKIDVTNSYNIIGVIKPSETSNFAKPSALHSDNVTNGVSEEELWPENANAGEGDEFDRMEKEVEMEIEKENEEKKKKRDSDKKGKKKRKKKGDSEKENKSITSDDELGTSVGKIRQENLSLHSAKAVAEKSLQELSLTDEEKRTPNTSLDEDDLSNISVRQLTASYLSVTEQQTSPQKRPDSPNITPLRPRTPISQLVETYSHSPSPPRSYTSTPVKNFTFMNGGSDTPTYPTDFTPGVSFQSLKSAYETSVNRSLIAQDFSPKQEVNVSFSQLRDTYCNVAASHSQERVTSPPPRSVTPSSRPVGEKLSPFLHNLEPTQVSSDCHICGKQVFQMEKIVAEKASWHKNCFRCKECNKNLTLETYQSHEGTLYCKPHFKELFRPKAVIQDEAEERKDRSTSKPDYGLEELQQTSLNVREKFAVFENLSKEEEKPRPEPVSVRRSQSLMSKAARFLDGQEDGECYDNEEDDEEEEEDEEEEVEGGEGDEDGVDEENDGTPVVKSRSKKKKERPMSFSGMGDLKSAWEQKQRREEMSQSRKEEITRFRQMLCAGKNLTLKEKFESGTFDDHENGDSVRTKEEIKIEGKRAASNLKKRFEQGQPFILEDDDEEEEDEEGVPKRRERIPSEKQEVEEIFKDAETAKKARNVFKQIDSKVAKEGTVILRSPSFASSTNRDNRHSMDASVLMQQSAPIGEVVKSSAKIEDYTVDTTDLASRFKFFSNYEKDKEKERESSRKVFRITPPREGIDQVEDMDISKAIMPKPCMAVNCAVCKLRRSQASDGMDLLGRDPNLIKCSDNYQDEVDCRNTRNILEMFKKMEMGGDEEDEEAEGPKPLKRFTPPPGAEEHEDESEEYSDEEYSDEEEEEEEEDEGDHASKVRDELLQMSARKAATLRAKFERWETEEAKQNGINKEKEELDELMPSLDTARNLKAIFEHKAIEVTKPVASKPITQKVNRFVGGGGDKCVCCGKTVYVMEKLDIHGKVLHKHCFKCFKCNTQLSMGSFSFGGGDHMFCITHYKQLFTEKGGSYDALTQEVGKWTKKIEEMNGELKSHD